MRQYSSKALKEEGQKPVGAFDMSYVQKNMKSRAGAQMHPRVLHMYVNRHYADYRRLLATIGPQQTTPPRHSLPQRKASSGNVYVAQSTKSVKNKVDDSKFK
ncbi:hypothetical protein JTB14_003747 [Gonioctena quinquepunctata]|nr:hypothetical protein JTB14_003747 [Gonioctena quinquepunctata]